MFAFIQWEGAGFLHEFPKINLYFDNFFISIKAQTQQGAQQQKLGKLSELTSLSFTQSLPSKFARDLGQI